MSERETKIKNFLPWARLVSVGTERRSGGGRRWLLFRHTHVDGGESRPRAQHLYSVSYLAYNAVKATGASVWLRTIVFVQSYFYRFSIVFLCFYSFLSELNFPVANSYELENISCVAFCFLIDPVNYYC